jgi:hypothetical protein
LFVSKNEKNPNLRQRALLPLAILVHAPRQFGADRAQLFGLVEGQRGGGGNVCVAGVEAVACECGARLCVREGGNWVAIAGGWRDRGEGGRKKVLVVVGGREQKQSGKVHEVVREVERRYAPHCFSSRE